MNTNPAPHYIPRGLPLRRGYNGDEENGVVKSVKANSFGDAAAVANGQAQQLVMAPARAPARNSGYVPFSERAPAPQQLTPTTGGLADQIPSNYAPGKTVGEAREDYKKAQATGVQQGANAASTKSQDSAGAEFGVGDAANVAGKTAIAATVFSNAGKTTKGLMAGGKQLVGKLGPWMWAAQGAYDAYTTPTSDYAERIFVTPGDNNTLQGKAKNFGIRFAGSALDLANNIFGFGDYVYPDKVRKRSQAASASAPEAEAKQDTSPMQPSQPPAVAKQSDANAAAVQQQMNRTALDPKVERAWRDQTPRGFTTASTPGVYRSGNSFTNIGADGKPTQASTDASQIRTNGGGSMAGVSPAISRALSAARLQAAREGRFDDVAASYGGQPRGLPGVAAPVGGGVPDRDAKSAGRAAAARKSLRFARNQAILEQITKT